jgi:hypothetical protein
MACPKLDENWALKSRSLLQTVIGMKSSTFQWLDFLFLAARILHKFLVFSKNTADETEIRGTVEAPARAEK